MKLYYSSFKYLFYNKNKKMSEIPKLNLNNFWLTFVTGGISGICGKTVIAPIERVKYIFVVTSTDIRPAFHNIRKLERSQEHFQGNRIPKTVAWESDELSTNIPIRITGYLISNSRFTSDSCTLF